MNLGNMYKHKKRKKRFNIVLIKLSHWLTSRLTKDGIPSSLDAILQYNESNQMSKTITPTRLQLPPRLEPRRSLAGFQTCNSLNNTSNF